MQHFSILITLLNISILILIKLIDGYTVVLNQYLSGCELVFLTDLSFLACLHDCQARSKCASVNYHTRLHVCVENVASSDATKNCHFERKLSFGFVGKDETWDKVVLPQY